MLRHRGRCGDVPQASGKDAGGAARTGTFPTACTVGERLREVRTTVARSTHEERIMKTDVVRQPLMAAFATLFVFAVAAMAHAGASGVPEPHGPLLPEALIMQWRTAWPRFSMLLAGAAIFCSGVILGRQAMRYALYPVSTFITMPLFGLLAAGLLSGPAFLTEYAVCLLLVLSLRNYYASFRNGAYGFGEIFRASLYLGAIPLIHAPGLLLVLFMPAALAIFKRSTREQIVAVTGFLLPFAAWSYGVWVAGGDITGPAVVLWREFTAHGVCPIVHAAPAALVLPGLTLLLGVCGVCCYAADRYSVGSKSRAILLLNTVLFALTVVMGLLPCQASPVDALTAVPAAVLLPLVFVRLNRLAALLLYALLVAALVAPLFF